MAQVMRAIFSMESVWRFPDAFVKIDGYHISVKCPHEGNEESKEYYNFKNFFSIVMLGIGAADYRLLWANFGFPGSGNNACAFQKSRFYSDIVSCDALRNI